MKLNSRRWVSVGVGLLMFVLMDGYGSGSCSVMVPGSVNPPGQQLAETGGSSGS